MYAEDGAGETTSACRPLRLLRDVHLYATLEGDFAVPGGLVLSRSWPDTLESEPGGSS